MLTEEEMKKSRNALQAIITGNYEGFEASIQGISAEGLNAPVDKNGRTLLHYAATSRNEGFYNILVERGSITNVKDSNKWTPEQAREAAVRARTQWYGADINDPEVSRKCLMQAVQEAAKGKVYGALGILDIVRNDDANMQVNEHGHSVLHLACVEGSDPDFTSILMLKGCSLRSKDVDGNTPLHTAASTVNKNASKNLQVLCDQALVVDVNAKNNAGNTPLHVATGRMDHEKIDELLSRFSDISVANNEGKSVFHLVAEKWLRREISSYIEKVLKAVSTNIEGNRECAEALIFPDHEGISAVQHVIRRNVSDAVKVFETAINVADKVYSSNSPEMKALFTCPRAQDAQTLMHLVCSYKGDGATELIPKVLDEAALRFGGDPFSVVDVKGRAPIHLAAESGKDEKIFGQVAKHTPGEIINAVASDGRALIHIIVEDQKDHKEASAKLQALLERTNSFPPISLPSINLPSPVSGRTPVVSAYEKGSFGDVEKMLRCNGIDVDSPSNDGLTILHHAARDGNFEIVSAALTARNLKYTSFGKFPVRDEIPTPGVYAVREAKDPKGLEKVLDALMDREPNPQHVAVEAIKRGSRELLDHLIAKKVVDVNERFVNSEGQETTLAREALGAGKYDIVKYLIENGAAVEGLANESALSTGILGGCFQGRRAVLHMGRVIKAGASVNAPMGTLSPLAAAVRAVHEGANPKDIKGIIDSLVQQGANIGSMDEQGNPALHLALVNASSRKIAKVLIKAGANTEQLDSHGRTPLHVAAAVGDGAQFKVIAKASPDQCFSSHSYTGDTPLHEALASRAVTEKSFLKMLKEIKCQVSPECFLDVINARQLASGESLLHMAAARGYGKTCKILVNAGAEVSIVDIEGKTPADVAAPSLKARSWFFRKSVAKQLAERVQVPEGGFPPYVPEEHIPAGYRTPTWESISSLSSVSDLSSAESIGELSSDFEVEGPSAPSTPGVESIYTTAGAEAPEEPIYEDIKDVRGARDVESVYTTAGSEGPSAPSTPGVESIYTTAGSEGPSTPSTPGVESIYTTAGAEAPEEPIYEDIKDVRGAGDVESVYTTAGSEGPSTPSTPGVESIYTTAGSEGPSTPSTPGVESIYTTAGSEGPSAPSTPGVESIYTTAGSEGPSTPSTPGVESIYTTAGAEAPEEPIYEDIKDVRGAGDVESVYSTAGAAVTSETQEGVKRDSVRLRREKHESIYSEVKGSIARKRPESIYADPFDVVKPKQERPESIYADPFAAERTSSSGLTTSGPKEEPIYATVKKGPKKSDTSQKGGTASEKVSPTITVVKKKEKPQVPTRTSSLPTKEGIGSDKGQGPETRTVVKKKEKPQVPVRTSSLSPKGDLGSDKGQGPETSSSFAAELQAQRGKLRPVKGGAPDSTKDKTAASVFSSAEFKEELTKAAKGLQGAVEAQKGDGGAAKAKQDLGMESGAPGSQPEAPQSEGPKPVKGGGRGR
uniref:AnkA n=3 Tax=Anaplasma TaxID=768 RepID=D2KNE4_ANAPH|nr:AnkA [Anaplasma phagocytophilum]ADA72179.1 AnkA [Anaplasma phagocytophilum]AGL51279.1 AnkA [Anaplasma phagocytophilum]AGL51280.1 AnkA [Anaplasma phagocytophilum]